MYRTFITLAITLMPFTMARPASAQSVAAEMQRTVQSETASGKFMGSVLVVSHGKALVNQGYGSANLEWNIPNSPATKFRIGSVTKQFTAAAILLLEERGKLTLDDSVTKYVPDAPAEWKTITIFDLLTHTSGIVDIKSLPPEVFAQWRAATPEQLIARFRDKPLEFKPGSQAKYCNSDYILLGYIIERISGESYEDFMQQNIFIPLDMTSSGIDHNAAILPQRAQGYQLSRYGFQNADYIDMTIPIGAGDMYSTTGDLQKWEQGLFGGKLLSKASLKKMTTSYMNGFGLGVVVSSQDGHILISHTGGIQGFACELRFYPKDDLIIIVLGNIGADAPPREIAEALSHSVLRQRCRLERCR